MSEKFEFRSVFNEQSIQQSATQIKAIYPAFDLEAFVSETLVGFETLSFGDRNAKITDILFMFLPKDYLSALDILVQSLGKEIDSEELEGYEGFYVMPLSTYVSRYGHDDVEASLEALVEMTKRFTSEFGIRTFLQKHEEKTLQHLHLCTQSDNCHVRRLASEGSRPRLPLGSRLHRFIKDPAPVLKLLEALKDEPTRLVQRSIANNLNDIAKDNPNVVVTFLKRWQEEKVQDVAWIIKHATRTLIKEGHTGALELLGFNPHIELTHCDLKVQTAQVNLGEKLVFEATLHFNNSSKEKVVIDYLLHFQKANGQLKAKVFKLSQQSISKNTLLRLKKSHLLKQMSTRKLYEGVHAVEIQVNGKVVGEKQYFTLTL